MKMTTMEHKAAYPPIRSAAKRKQPTTCICGSESAYNEAYDSFFCKASNIWLDDKCSETDCDFCSKRPEKHIKRAKG
jgi:hypothetical protein